MHVILICFLGELFRGEEEIFFSITTLTYKKKKSVTIVPVQFEENTKLIYSFIKLYWVPQDSNGLYTCLWELKMVRYFSQFTYEEIKSKIG